MRCDKEGDKMVISAKEYKRRRDDLEIRISKMISEGGMAIEAHYFHDESLADQQDESKKVAMAKEKMISEGGLGTEFSYHAKDVNEDEKLMN